MRTIFALALCAFVTFMSCGPRSNPVSGVHVDPGLAGLVPSDTAILVGARLDQLRNTPVYQKHFSSMALPRLEEFTKETGVDPRKDVQEALFASDGGQKAVLMVRGNFPTRELENKLEQKGVAHTAYKGYNLFGDERNSMFFLNGNTAVAGSTTSLKNLVDHRSAGGIPATLQLQVKAIPAQAQFWAVFSGAGVKLPFPEESNLGNINHLVRSIQNGRFTADLSNGLDFQASGACNDNAGAKQIYDTLKGLIGIGRLSTPEGQPDLLKVYDAIDVRQDDRVVNIAAKVPQDMVDKFINLYAESRR